MLKRIEHVVSSSDKAQLQRGGAGGGEGGGVPTPCCILIATFHSKAKYHGRRVNLDRGTFPVRLNINGTSSTPQKISVHLPRQSIPCCEEKSEGDV